MAEGAGAQITPGEIGTPSFETVELNRPSAGARFPLTVAVLNMFGGSRLEVIASCFRRPPLRDAGVILLCEADWRTRRACGREVAAELASMLEMSFAYAPSFGLRSSGDPPSAFLGVAILSREPLMDVRATALPAPPALSRHRWLAGAPAGLIASAVVDRRSITLGVAHLDRNASPRFRESQMAHYLSAFPADGPAVIGGDFNTTTIDWTGKWGVALKLLGLTMTQPRRFRDPVAYEPLFGRLSEAGFDFQHANAPRKPTFTFTCLIPPFLRPKLDWIAVRGIRAVPGSAAVLAPRVSPLSPRASDHDIVACKVTL
jgi:endonuclease/exonuclease/phosphatase family metal-dependent hydrolase